MGSSCCPQHAQCETNDNGNDDVTIMLNQYTITVAPETLPVTTSSASAPQAADESVEAGSQNLQDKQPPTIWSAIAANQPVPWVLWSGGRKRTGARSLADGVTLNHGDSVQKYTGPGDGGDCHDHDHDHDDHDDDDDGATAGGGWGFWT